MLEHLLERGYRRVHLLGVPADLGDGTIVTPQVQRRIGSLISTLHADGAEVIPVELPRPLWDADTGYDTATRALAEAGPVRAGVALNDALAAGAYEAFREAGLRIPHDVSVVSFDDDDIVSYLRPKLTAVALPFEAMGRRAAELALGGAVPGSSSNRYTSGCGTPPGRPPDKLRAPPDWVPLGERSAYRTGRSDGASEEGVADPQRPVSGEAELGEFAFDVDVDGAEEVDVLAVRWGDVGQDLVALVHGCGYERIATRACSDRTIRRRLVDWAQLGLALMLPARRSGTGSSQGVRAIRLAGV